MSLQLTTSNHNRDIAGLRYVYPVLSRRAGGLSIGINLNPNNACNWRCIYCQVPGLTRGTAPDIDLALLATELRGFLDYVQSGEFYRDFKVEAAQQCIKDVAISGNGEPSSVKNFAEVIHLLGDIASSAGIFPAAKFVLISNGSLIQQSNVQEGLRALAQYQGELWFKLDSASFAGRKLVNNTVLGQARLLEHLKIARALCPTKLQTCMLQYRGQLWTASEKQAYLELLKALPAAGILIRQIMLYSIARQSFQPEADELQAMPLAEMQAFADQISALGYQVSVSA